MVDSNNPLTGVDYVIPGNDDAIRAIQLYTSVVADEVIQAKASSQTLSGDEDEFVEVKESESKKAKPAKSAKTVKSKATVKKKAAAKAEQAAAEAPVEETTPAAEENPHQPAESSD